MHSFKASTSVFNFNGDLSGPVMVTMYTPNGEQQLRFSLPGDDLRALIMHLQREYPGALNDGAEHPLDVLADKMQELTERVDRMQQALMPPLRARCGTPGCLLDAGHIAECRKLEAS